MFDPSYTYIVHINIYIIGWIALCAQTMVHQYNDYICIIFIIVYDDIPGIRASYYTVRIDSVPHHVCLIKSALSVSVECGKCTGSSMQSAVAEKNPVFLFYCYHHISPYILIYIYINWHVTMVASRFLFCFLPLYPVGPVG